MGRHANKNKYVSHESVDDLNYLKDNIKRIKFSFNITEQQIYKLLNKGYTFSEIEQGDFNTEGVFIPKEIIMEKTKEYLFSDSIFNTYANQG